MASSSPLPRTCRASIGKKPEGFSIFAGDIYYPLGFSELSRLATTFPILFIKREENFVPVILMGLLPGQNLFIDPQGTWLGRFVPNGFLGYPFLLSQDASGNVTLLVDEEALTDTPSSNAHPLFDSAPEAPKFSPETEELLRFLLNRAQDYSLNFQITQTLKEEALLKPVDLSFDLDGKKHLLQGFHLLDYEKFQALPSERFLRLKDLKALELIYSHLISLSNLELLVNLQKLRQSHTSSKNSSQEQASPSHSLEKLLQDLKFPS